MRWLTGPQINIPTVSCYNNFIDIYFVFQDEDEPNFSRRLDRDEIAGVMKEQFNIEVKDNLQIIFLI